jgi:uncharacterized protein YecE (DUF72 family)
MEFGKLSDIQQVNFDLPPTPAFSFERLKTYKQERLTTSPNLFVGCTGWANPEWVGNYYPPHSKNTDFLKYYSQQFNSVELNTTHYQIPTAETVQNWYKKAENSSFKFAPKMPQLISHANTLRLAVPTMQLFCQNVRFFNEKLGIVFTQLPERFGIAQLDDLEQFIKYFPADIPHAVEVRHCSFFEKSGKNAEKLFSLLANYNTTAVITDVAGRRDVLHQYICNDTVVIRFIGNENEQSDYPRITEWAQILRLWVENGLKNIYFFCHQPNNLHAPKLVSNFCQQIQSINGWAVKIPKNFENPNSQFSLF